MKNHSADRIAADAAAKVKKKFTDPAFINGMAMQFHAGLKQAANAGSDTFCFDFETDKGPGAFIVLVRPCPAGTTAEDMGAGVLVALQKGHEVLMKELETQA